MPLLNYTTQISVDKTLSEIQQMLARGGASHILTEYDTSQNVTAISFKVQCQFGVMPFRLPCEPRAVQQILNNQVKARKIPKRFFNDMDQARRVGWRIIRQWLEAQLAIVETQMVTIDQVFLPYAQSHNGQTLYELMSDKRFDMLALEGPKP